MLFLVCIDFVLTLYVQITCSVFKEGRNWIYLMTHSTHFITVIWHRTYGKGPTTQIVREETLCCHMGYSFRLAARVLLYASSHRQDNTYHRQGNTYHSLCYTSRGTLAGTRNSSMGPPWRIDPTTHRTMSERSYHGATSRSCSVFKNNVNILF